jgi:hypothetical protein
LHLDQTVRTRAQRVYASDSLIATR